MGEQGAMRIVVTGGAGFIGSHFIEKIVNEGIEAVVVDNLITGSVDNIKEHIDQGKVELIQQDVQEFIDIEGEVVKQNEERRNPKLLTET